MFTWYRLDVISEVVRKTVTWGYVVLVRQYVDYRIHFFHRLLTKSCVMMTKLVFIFMISVRLRFFSIHLNHSVHWNSVFYFATQTLGVISLVHYISAIDIHTVSSSVLSCNSEWWSCCRVNLVAFKWRITFQLMESARRSIWISLCWRTLVQTIVRYGKNSILMYEFPANVLLVCYFVIYWWRWCKFSHFVIKFK